MSPFSDKEPSQFSVTEQSAFECGKNIATAAANERIRMLDDELKFKLAELELMVRSRSSIKELLITERAVSDRLLEALKEVTERAEVEVGDFSSVIEIQQARDIIAEVEAMRSKDK